MRIAVRGGNAASIILLPVNWITGYLLTLVPLTRASDAMHTAAAAQPAPPATP